MPGKTRVFFAQAGSLCHQLLQAGELSSLIVRRRYNSINFQEFAKQPDHIRNFAHSPDNAILWKDVAPKAG